MSIQDAVAILGFLWVAGHFFATLFVTSKITKAVVDLKKEMASTYLPREVAEAQFRYYDYRMDGEHTPRVARRQAASDGV